MYHKLQIYRLIVIFLFTLLCASQNVRAEAGHVTILAEQFWPYSFTDPDNPLEKPRGISVDFAEAVFENAGIECDVRMLPWTRVMKHAREEPNQLIITLVRSAPRENQFHWIGQIAEIKHALYGTMTEPDRRPASLESARTMSVSSVVGDVAHDYLKARGFEKIVTTSSYLKGLEMLVRGRIDLYPGNTGLIDYQCAQIDGGCNNVALVLPLEDLEQDLYFAFSSQTADEIVDRVRASFDKLVAQGRLESIRQVYLNQAESP